MYLNENIYQIFNLCFFKSFFVVGVMLVNFYFKFNIELNFIEKKKFDANIALF